MPLVINKSGKTYSMTDYTGGYNYGTIDPNEIFWYNATAGTATFYSASAGKVVSGAVDGQLSDDYGAGLIKLAYTSAYDYGAGNGGYIFNIRRKARVWHPNGYEAFSLYAGDRVSVSGGSSGASYDPLKLEITGYSQGGGAWVDVAAGTGIDTDIDYGYCKPTTITTYGQW